MADKHAVTTYHYSNRFTKHIIYFLFMTVTAFLLTGCDSGPERKQIDFNDRISDEELPEIKTDQPPNTFFFGFDLRRPPEEDARQYLPLLTYLDKVTGYHFKLRFTPNGTSISNRLGTGEIHFAIIGAGSYLKAHLNHGVIPVVRGLNRRGKAEYRSMIIVAADSRLTKIDDLRGKKFAFGNIASTQGHLIPRIVLAENGLELDDLDFYQYTGSHYDVANAVTSGHFDAGAIQDTMAAELAENGMVKILHTSGYYPSGGIAANRDVPPEIIARVKQALMDFQPNGRDAKGLYNWDRTEMPNGFVEAGSTDYEELMKWAVRFGYMSDNRPGDARP